MGVSSSKAKYMRDSLLPSPWQGSATNYSRWIFDSLWKQLDHARSQLSLSENCAWGSATWCIGICGLFMRLLRREHSCMTIWHDEQYKHDKDVAFWFDFRSHRWVRQLRKERVYACCNIMSFWIDQQIQHQHYPSSHITEIFTILPFCQYWCHRLKMLSEESITRLPTIKIPHCLPTTKPGKNVVTWHYVMFISKADPLHD